MSQKEPTRNCLTPPNGTIEPEKAAGNGSSAKKFAVFEKMYGRTLTETECIEIAANMIAFFETLEKCAGKHEKS